MLTSVKNQIGFRNSRQVDVLLDPIDGLRSPIGSHVRFKEARNKGNNNAIKNVNYIISSIIIIFSILTSLYFYESSTNEKQNEKITSNSNTDILKQDSLEETLKTIPKNLKTVFGHRFIISGDFDGDRKKEKFIEHFFSGLDNKETNKFYDNLSDYGQLVALTVKKESISFISCENKLIDTLYISSSGQHLGLSYLKNEGDLNGDGTDEISYVVNWVDWSNLNTWYIATYKNKKWSELYSFPIWDWQLPALSETFAQYGLFELEQKIISTANDTMNKRIGKELKNFKDL